MPRLLLVEDHKPVRLVLREGLEVTGEAVVVAEASTARGDRRRGPENCGHLVVGEQQEAERLYVA